MTDGLRMLYEDIVPADGSSNYLNSIDGCLTCTGILFLDVTEKVMINQAMCILGQSLRLTYLIDMMALMGHCIFLFNQDCSLLNQWKMVFLYNNTSLMILCGCLWLVRCLPGWLEGWPAG